VPEIEKRRKKPLVISVLLWDGTNPGQVAAFTGNGRNVLHAGGQLDVWNNQEHAWFAVPCGHYVVRSTLGEFYPMSQAAYEGTTEPVTGHDSLPPDSVLRDRLAALADEIEAFDGSGLGWRVQIAARIRQLLEAPGDA
jgi:hypothetical protein